MMGKEGKSTVAPRLRFPEFREAHGWDVKSMGDLIFLEYGASLPEHSRCAGLIPVVGSNGVVGYHDEALIEGPAIVIGRKGSVGQVTWIESDCFPIDTTFYVTNKNPENSMQFLYRVLQLSKLEQRRDPGAVPGLNRNEVHSLKIAVPEEAEQQKIADCLASLDEVIAAQAQKMEALKTYKRGLMQQLFPREGETLPRLRFPEFRDAPEWEEVALGEIAEIKLGKMLDSRKHTTGRLLPYLNNVSLRWNDVDTSNLPQMYFEDGELDRYGLKAGDVVVCEGGEPGRSAVWDGRLLDLKFQKAIHRVRFNVPFEPHLLVLYLEAIASTTRFEMLFTGGGIKHLTREAFAQLRIPRILQTEQQRIANYFSSLNKQIAVEAKKFDALKNYKQGMMVHLFPVVGATEGNLI
jgi:type I restriction enzyme S subunit